MSWIARVLLVACLGWVILPLELVAQTESPTTAIDEQEKKLLGIQRDIAVLKEATRLRLEAQEARAQKDLHDLRSSIEQQDSRFAAQLEAQEVRAQNDLYDLQSRIDQQDSRISDVHVATGRLGMVLTVFAGLVTLFVAVTGLAAWYRAGAKARETAQEWIARHESARNDDGRETVSEMRADVVRVSQALLAAATGMATWYSTETRAKEATQERAVRHESERSAEAITKRKAAAMSASHAIQADLDAIAVQAEQVIGQLQARLTSIPLSFPTAAQVEVLDAQERRLKQKPESEYTFKDWESRAYAAYASKQFDLAASFFLQASKAAATPGQAARSQVARGAMLVELNRSEEAVIAFEQVVTRFGEATDQVLREQVAQALLHKGAALGRLTRSEESLAAYEQVVARFGEATELVLCEQVAQALLHKGAALSRLTRGAEAIATYEQVVTRFGEATEPVLREQVAKALFNKGVALGRLTRGEEALAAYEQVVARFGEAADPILREQVVKALLNKGVVLGRLTRNEDAIAVYDQVVARFDGATEPVLRDGVAKALVNKGVTLGRLARNEEAIAAYEQVLARFGEATEQAFREGVAKAMVNKGVALGLLTRNEEAIAVYEQVLARFGGATEPALREQVARTFSRMGLHQLLKAKCSWHDTDVRGQLLSAARSNFDRSLERDAQNSSTLGNLGYLLFLSGQREQAIESLQYALTLDGEEFYQDMAKIIEAYSVPDDAEFRIVLDKIWLED